MRRSSLLNWKGGQFGHYGSTVCSH